MSTDRIDVTDIPGDKPRPKKSYVASAKELVAKHKKSTIMVIAVVVVIAIILIVWAHNCPDAFVAKYVPTWGSPDVKLLNKNHTGDTCRSDNKVDGWSKSDYMAAVEKFNSLVGSAE